MAGAAAACAASCWFPYRPFVILAGTWMLVLPISFMKANATKL